MAPLQPRTKKLILVLSAFPFLVAYMGAALALYDGLSHLLYGEDFRNLRPYQRVVEVIYFVLAGTLWAFPLKPLMKWVNRPVDEDAA